MKRFILYTFTAFTLLSCGGSEGQFRLKGEFAHLQQGEFYIYSPDGGTTQLDTIKITNGEFDYQTELEHSATYFLMYPNFSEQVIFGNSGDVITVQGDARHLKSTTVKGNQANEEMTDFRLTHQDKKETEIRQAAGAFIEQHPQSPASVYLFKQYFFQSAQATPNEITRFYQMLHQAQPENTTLLLWKEEIERGKTELSVGKKIPDFHFTVADNKEVKASDYQGKYLLINFWASWESTSSTQMFRIKRLRRANPGKIEIVSISLDLDKTRKENIERIDSVVWPSYCDFKAWQSPVVKQFNPPSVPYCILVGPDLRILAIGSSFEEEVMPEISKILKGQK